MQARRPLSGLPIPTPPRVAAGYGARSQGRPLPRSAPFAGPAYPAPRPLPRPAPMFAAPSPFPIAAPVVRLPAPTPVFPVMAPAPFPIPRPVPVAAPLFAPPPAGFFPAPTPIYAPAPAPTFGAAPFTYNYTNPAPVQAPYAFAPTTTFAPAPTFTSAPFLFPFSAPAPAASPMSPVSVVSPVTPGSLVSPHSASRRTCADPPPAPPAGPQKPPCSLPDCSQPHSRQCAPPPEFLPTVPKVPGPLTPLPPAPPADDHLMRGFQTVLQGLEAVVQVEEITQEMPWEQRYLELRSKPTTVTVAAAEPRPPQADLAGVVDRVLYEADDVVYVPRYIDRPIVVAPRIPAYPGSP